MKMKQSAAKAALKPTENKFTSGVLKTGPGAAVTIQKPIETKATLSATKASSAEATIEVKVDVGFGNALYLRGQGSGLNWERGVPLSCVDGGTWRWSQTVASPITFKVLLNDQVWSAGKDLVVAPGQKVEVSPTFA